MLLLNNSLEPGLSLYKMSIIITVGPKPSNHPFYNRGSKYCFYLDGVPGKELNLVPGTKYHFSINAPGHPFYFTTSEDGGSEDQNMLSLFVPTDKGEVDFVMPDSYPASFYYQCRIHLYMGGSAKSTTHHTFYLAPILTGLSAPTSLAAPIGENAIYVADQIGIVYKCDLTNNNTSIFLDVRQYIPTLNPNYDERGILGLCFHPNYSQNGRLFIYYSSRSDRKDQSYEQKGTSYYNCLSEFVFKNNAIQYDAEKVILRMNRDLNFHQGGKIGFGPDGYLYITVGDGGPQRDPKGNAQNLGTWFGKILRIDVNIDAYPYYRVPTDNPFVNTPGVLPEIWAYGFRNPWGLEFYQNVLIVSDAGFESGSGQEKINIVVKGGNYGWNVKEGTRLAQWAPKNADIRNMIDPIFSYTTADLKFVDSDTSVIIGGYLTDTNDYICADYSGRLIRLRFNQNTAQVVEMASVGKWIRSFGKSNIVAPTVGTKLYLLTSKVSGPSGNTGEVSILTVV